METRHMFPVSPVVSMAGPVLVPGDTGDALVNAMRSAAHFLDLADLAVLIGRRETCRVFLGKAQEALESVQ